MTKIASKFTHKQVVSSAIVIITLIVIGVMIIRQKSKLASEKAPTPVPVAVEVRQLQIDHFLLTLPLIADVQAVNEANIASRLTGYVTGMKFSEGERVKKGEVLVQLDKADVESQLQRAEADLARIQFQQSTLQADLAAARIASVAARDRVSRARRLYEIQGVSLELVQAEQSNLAASEARLSSTQAAVAAYQTSLSAAQSAVRAARKNLEYAEIQAPFDGIIAARPVQVGDLATPGKLLIRIVSMGEQRLLVNLPDTVHSVALLWQEHKLALKPWPEALTQGMRRYEARFNGLTPGTRVPVKLLTFDAEGVFLPETCLLNNDGLSATVFQLPPSGQAKPIKINLVASGSEGVASLDRRLNNIKIACGGSDVLTRLHLGVPFTTVQGD